MTDEQYNDWLNQLTRIHRLAPAGWFPKALADHPEPMREAGRALQAHLKEQQTRLVVETERNIEKLESDLRVVRGRVASFPNRSEQ